MKIQKESLIISTSKKIEFINLTESVNERIEKYNIELGKLEMYIHHTTAGLWVNEYEKGVLMDMEVFMENFAPIGSEYNHNKLTTTKNGEAHIRSTLFDTDVFIPIVGNKLDLGKYQSLILVELDGPRSERRLTLDIYSFD